MMDGKKHGELVDLAVIQLKRWNCLPVCREMVIYDTSEIPDAIGWTYRASIMFECKASRGDFLADKKKLMRSDIPEYGVGDFRFYLTNPGIVKDETELPHGWGCYEVIDGKIKHKFGVRYDNAVPLPLNGNKLKELRMMRSYIRRLNHDR